MGFGPLLSIAGLAMRLVQIVWQWPQKWVTGSAPLNRGCHLISKQVTTELTDKFTPIVRRDVDEVFARFLVSEVRYGSLLGAKGVGKSTLLATQWKRLAEDNRVVLLIQANEFSVEKLAQRIRHRSFRWLLQRDWDEVLVGPFKGRTFVGAKQMLVLIDGVDECDLEKFCSELKQLHNEIFMLEPTRYKVVISCGSSQWEQVREELHTTCSITALQEIVELGDFNDQELTEAAGKIGVAATPASTLGVPQGQRTIPPHMEVMRHPGIYGLARQLHSERKKLSEKVMSEPVS